MLRITENLENDQTIRLRLDGTISSDSVGELEEMIAMHQSSNSDGVILDMVGVSFMNEAAAKKLAALRGGSLRIINCSPFISALLDMVEKTD
jgi:anti-anti-sigma regulatory factor